MLHKWLAFMVDLKISSRSEGVALQYLSEELLKQLFVIVVLKSVGGFKLLRSFMTGVQMTDTIEFKNTERIRKTVAKKEAIFKSVLFSLLFAVVKLLLIGKDNRLIHIEPCLHVLALTDG